MAEQRKDKKPSLKDFLEDLDEDDDFSFEDRVLAREKVLEIEYKEWSKRVDKQ
jgi:hypothetical protein